MAIQARQAEDTHVPVIKEGPAAFGLIFVTAFGVFMAIALISQLLGFPWRSWLPGAESVKSVFGGVKAAVYTFMSHLQ
jgi:light-harvesting complex 1 beta chain